MDRRRVWVLGVVVTVAVAMSVPAPAAAALPDRDNLVTAAEVDRASTRSGWQAVPWRAAHGFDCGSFAVMRTFADHVVRRGFQSDTDSSAAASVASFATRALARAAHGRTVATLRSCVTGVQRMRLRTDEQLPLPGRARLVQLYSAPKCCGSDTHSFGVVQRGRRTALVWLGELGKTPRGPMRGLVAAASDRLVR